MSFQYQRFSDNRRRLGVVAAAAILAVTGLIGVRAATEHEAANPPANVKMAQHLSHGGYSGVIKQVLPAVVSISSSKMVKQTGNELPDDFFRQFFGDQGGGQQFQGGGQQFGGRQFGMRGNPAQPQERKESGLGSGVIVSSNGYILTNNHVIDGATDIKVMLSDNREFKGRVVGTDKRTDIAVVKIEANDLPTLALADSSKLEVGDIVLAIGNPFGVGETVTSGIVSATGRSLGGTIEQLEDFIQTDAAINPGNSGGALIDDEGHLVGINTAILGGSGGNVGIGFAVPINLAKHDMDSILAHGNVESGYLGVYIEDVTPSLAKAFNTSANGALVGDVTAGTPAAKAGLQKGDIVTALNGQQIHDRNQLQTRIGTMDPGAVANLKVLRGGRTMDVAVTLGTRQDDEQVSSRGSSPSRGESSGLEGVTVENLTANAARQLKVSPQTQGVVVSSVSESSAASEAGLQQGDVILEVNHHEVSNTADFNRTVNSAPKGNPILLLVNRGGNTTYIAIS